MFIIQEKIEGDGYGWYDLAEDDGTLITYETKEEAEANKAEYEMVMDEFFGRFDTPNILKYRIIERLNT